MAVEQGLEWGLVPWHASTTARAAARYSARRAYDQPTGIWRTLTILSAILISRAAGDIVAARLTCSESQEPFEKTWPRIVTWLELEPDRTAKQLLLRIQAENRAAR